MPLAPSSKMQMGMSSISEKCQKSCESMNTQKATDLHSPQSDSDPPNEATTKPGQLADPQLLANTQHRTIKSREQVFGMQRIQLA